MRRTPWALALLALTLPAPALSEPLHGLSLADTLWNQVDDGYDSPTPAYADRPWPRYRHALPEEALGSRFRQSWRQRTATAPFDGYGYGDGYRDRDRYGYGYGYSEPPADDEPYSYRPGRRTPLAVIPAVPPSLRRCGPGAALVGAAIGGGLGAALSDGSRQRQWALPMGATVGGLLGGVLAGC